MDIHLQFRYVVGTWFQYKYSKSFIFYPEGSDKIRIGGGHQMDIVIGELFKSIKTRLNQKCVKFYRENIYNSTTTINRHEKDKQWFT